MSVVAPGKYVSFTYQINELGGELLELMDVPVSYVHGCSQGLLDKVEAAMAGAKEGDEVEVLVSPDEGFGPHLAELTFVDDIDNVPSEFRQIGAEVEMKSDRGDVKMFRVSRIENGKLTVDGNHPFAGKSLSFRLGVVEVRDASPSELQAASQPPSSDDAGAA